MSEHKGKDEAADEHLAGTGNENVAPTGKGRRDASSKLGGLSGDAAKKLKGRAAQLEQQMKDAGI